MINTTSQVLYDGVENAVMQFTGASDGAGQEFLAVKVDASTLNPPADLNLKIRKVTYNVYGGAIQLLWNADVPVPFLNLSFEGEFDYKRLGWLLNNAGAGVNGDILLSTRDFGLNSSYSLVIEMRKN